jgi:hypothetical protein
MMSPSDEQLLHDFYGGDNGALEQLAARHDPILARIAHQVLLVRAGPGPLILGEWDIDERLVNVWAHVHNTREANFGRWPYQQLSGLRWLIFLLCAELDRNMGMRGPF